MGRRERFKIVLKFIGDKSFREEFFLWVFEYFIILEIYRIASSDLAQKPIDQRSPIFFYKIKGLCERKKVCVEIK